MSLRDLILRPIVHGLVVSESTASFVTDLVIAYRPIPRFKKLLFQIASELICADLKELTREGKTATLWEETEKIRIKRNAVLHSACSVSIEQAIECLEIAAYVLESLFPRFLDELGLALDGNDYIRDKGQIQSEKFMEQHRSVTNT